MDTGLLIARPSRGFAIGVHAVQKLLGWLGGEGLKGTGGGLGFWPGVLFALAAGGLGEAGGGLLTAAGFLGAVGPALIILVMWRSSPFTGGTGPSQRRTGSSGPCCT